MSASKRFKGYLSAARQWFFRTPERALDQAYDAALMIKAIEDEHFDGQPIAPRVKSHGDNVDAYFQAELRKCLSTARVRLAEFRASRLFINLSENAPTSMGRTGAVPPPEGWFAERSRDRPEETSAKCAAGEWKPQTPTL